MTDVKANETVTETENKEPDFEDIGHQIDALAQSLQGIADQFVALAQSLQGGVDDTDEPEEGEDEPEANANAEEPTASNPAKARLLEYINNLK